MLHLRCPRCRKRLRIDLGELQPFDEEHAKRLDQIYADPSRFLDAMLRSVGWLPQPPTADGGLVAVCPKCIPKEQAAARPN
jgi:hypothetical protein